MQLSHYIVIVLVFLTLCACSGPADNLTNAEGPPKVILIIGDGMDDQQISIARNYLTGSNGQLAMDSMQYRGSLRVQSVSEENPAEYSYVTGSAASATALASGIVSSGLRISTFPESDEDAVTIMELANAAGIGTGVVTTASVTDATPASFMAHVSSRRCQGPANMARDNARNPGLSYECTGDYKKNGGAGSIAEQIADGTMDVVLGGGMQYFDQVAEGESETLVLQQARTNGFEVITQRSQLQTIPPGNPILGLFSPDLMPPMLSGNGANISADTDTGNASLPEPYACEKNRDFADLPRVLDMTKAAISQLESLGSFMLVIENEATDEHVYARQPCGHIGGVAQIDETLKYVLQYAETHPELLVIVTADHGHAAQIISEQRTNASPGHTARLITADGTVLGINYATTKANSREGHSGVQVPILASGPGVDQWPIFMRQTEVFHLVRKHLSLEENLTKEL